MDEINIGLVWECPCDNRERLLVNVRIPASTTYQTAELTFRTLWDEFRREMAKHGNAQKS